MKKPLIILGSARKSSDTEKLCNLVLDQVPFDLIDLLDYTISHYDYYGQYPEGDQFMEVANQMVHYDTLVFATPVYWYAMSSYLKVFFDRITDLTRIQRSVGRQLAGKTMFLLTTSASEAMPEGFEVPFASTADYLNMQYGGGYFTPSYQFEKLYPGKEEFAKRITASLKDKNLLV